MWEIPASVHHRAAVGFVVPFFLDIHSSAAIPKLLYFEAAFAVVTMLMVLAVSRSACPLLVPAYSRCDAGAIKLTACAAAHSSSAPRPQYFPAAPSKPPSASALAKATESPPPFCRGVVAAGRNGHFMLLAMAGAS